MRVLVVDDDPAVRETVAVLLSLLGHSACTAAGGAEALAMLRRERFDTVLLDYLMPEMTGIELFEKLRAMGIDVPVGFITGSRGHPNVEKLLGQATPILFKPFAPAEFKTFINKLQTSHLSASSWSEPWRRG